MTATAYVLVFDSLADWEPALATAEINRSDKPISVVTVGFSKEPVTTMGGLRILPELTLADVSAEEAAIFILSGGERWEQQPIEEELIQLVRHCHSRGVPIAAICGATLVVGKAGLLDNRRHTSNARFYLQHFLPDYKAAAWYVEEAAVSDNNLITASGLGYVEFAREIFRQLALYNEDEIATWYEMFKHSVLPAPLAAAYAEQLNQRG